MSKIQYLNYKNSISSISSLGYTTTGEVVVTVLDANDHAPVFEQNPYRVEVGELYPLNKNLDVEIRATDADTGPNSEVREIILFFTHW